MNHSVANSKSIVRKREMAKDIDSSFTYVKWISDQIARIRQLIWILPMTINECKPFFYHSIVFYDLWLVNAFGGILAGMTFVKLEMSI